MKMKKRNKKYWQGRFIEVEESANRIGLEAYKKMEPGFNAAEKMMDQEIQRWYYRIAKNNELTITEAKKLLNKEELEEFRWTLKDYIKYGEKNGLDGKYMRQLENASAKFHITRLEVLKLHTQHQLERAFGNELDLIDDMASTVITDSYYRSIFELSKGFGVGFDIANIDKRKLDLLKKKPWATDGKNFSFRIWNKKSDMVERLHRELTKNVLLGKAPDSAIAIMSQYVSKNIKHARKAAGRLVMTEQAYFSQLAQKEAFNELGIEEFEIVATLDSHTSEICREMDGHHFPMNEFSPGSTAPPFHPWCRSCTCPYFDDEFTVDEKRVARDEETGKTYYVSSDITYEKWRDKYLKIDSEYTLKGKMNHNRLADEKQYENYKNILGENVPKNLEEFQEMKYNNSDRWKIVKVDYARRNKLINNPSLSLPNVEKVEIDDRKFTEYLFGGKNKKGLNKGKVITKRLGYDINNYNELKKEISERARFYPSKYKNSDEYGSKYEQKIILYGKFNNPTNVVVGWKVNGSKTHLVTVYIKEIKND